MALLWYDACNEEPALDYVDYSISENGGTFEFTTEQARSGVGCYKFEMSSSGYRSELTLLSNGLRFLQYKTVYWIGYSLMFPPGQPTRENMVIGQLHGTPDNVGVCDEWRNPVFSVTTKLAPMNTGCQLRAQIPLCGGVPRVYDREKYWSYPDNPVTSGVWHDFVWNFRLSFDPDDPGFFKVWMDGDLLLDDVGINCFNDAVEPYFKFGMYDVGSTTPDIAYYDEIRVGDANSNLVEMSPDLGSHNSVLYLGWPNTDGVPSGTPNDDVGLASDRTYLREVTPNTSGYAYSVRIYVYDVWDVTKAWVVAYKLQGTTLVCIGYASVLTLDLNSWTDEIQLIPPASGDMSVSSSDTVYVGMAASPSDIYSAEVGRNGVGGDGLIWSTKVLSGDTPHLLLAASDLEPVSTGRDMAFILGVSSTPTVIGGNTVVSASPGISTTGAKTARGSAAVSAGGRTILQVVATRSATVECSAGALATTRSRVTRFGICQIAAPATTVLAGSPIRARETRVWATPGIILAARTTRVGGVEVGGVATLSVATRTERRATTLVTAVPTTVLVGSASLASPLVSFINLIGSTESPSLIGDVAETILISGGVTVTAVAQNFTMHAGDSKSISITVDGHNLQGASVIFKAARAVDSSEVMITKSSGSGIQITGTGNSVISIALQPADTQTMEGKYYFEVEVTDVDGRVSTVTTGRMVVLQTLIH